MLKGMCYASAFFYNQRSSPKVAFSTSFHQKHVSVQQQNNAECLLLVEILLHLFLPRRWALSTLTACRAGSRLNFVCTKSFSQEAHAKRFMGRSGAKGELLNFLQTASFWREKAASLHRVYMQTVSGSSEMLVRAKPNIKTEVDTHQAYEQYEAACADSVICCVGEKKEKWMQCNGKKDFRKTKRLGTRKRKRLCI